MRYACCFIFFSSLLCFVLGAQPAVDATKLTKAQKNHLLIYKQMDALIRAKKVDHVKFFHASYGPVVDASKKHQNLNLRMANELQEKANRLLNDNKTELAQRTQYIARLFLEMANVNSEMVKAYEKGEVPKVEQAVTKYISIEGLMRKAGAKPPAREWFTSVEAATVLAQLEAAK